MIIKINGKEYSFDGYVNPINSVQKLAEDIYQQGRADAFKEFVDSYREFCTTSPNESCLKEDIECDGMCVDCFEKWVTNKKEQKNE